MAQVQSSCIVTETLRSLQIILLTEDVWPHDFGPPALLVASQEGAGTAEHRTQTSCKAPCNP